ncbi:MAG: hypothetical protein M0C28_40480 [Candidatus Moduliflexus flocculans]|nr:hypothetical protein [Candidatus Moduliflexus flocculans]
MAMGERPFRAAQIFDWLYKKQASRCDELHQPVEAASREAGRPLRPRRARGRRPARLGRRHDQAPPPPRRRRARRDRPHPGPDRTAPDGVPVDPGRLQVRLRLLRQRPPRLQAQPRRRPRSPARPWPPSARPAASRATSSSWAWASRSTTGRTSKRPSGS